MAAGERKKHEIKVPSDETNPDVVPTAIGECCGAHVAWLMYEELVLIME